MAELDRIIHEPARLRIMSALAAIEPGGQMDFARLRDVLALTDGNLGAHLARLEAAEYIKVDKAFVDRKPRTSLSITDKGRDAFNGHVEALREIIRSPKTPP